MWDWIRASSIGLAGLLVGLAIGFGIWADAPGEGGFERAYRDGERVFVESVVDGDTVRLDDRMHVRYRGCDTPEVFRFVRDPSPGAEEASARNRELVEGTWVRLRFPPAGRPAVDQHGRLLADVFLDPGAGAPRESVGETLVREGLAKVNSYEMDGSQLERLRAAEAQAREAKRGVWAESAVVGTVSAGGAPFVASRYGKYVHSPDCEYAKRINPRNLMKFHTLEAALSTERGRCPTCLGGKRFGKASEKASKKAPDKAPEKTPGKEHGKEHGKEPGRERRGAGDEDLKLPRL